MAKRRILVTSALPYANGSIHLGHLVEYIQTDIWVRFQKMQGHEVHYVCADDTHGTAIMLRAEKEGITPEALIGARAAKSTSATSRASMSLSTTTTPRTRTRTRALSAEFYKRLKSAGLIDVKPVEQFYDPVKAMFLPDRFIKGECPKCGAKDQYGDSCEVCGVDLQPHRSQERLLRRLRRDAGAEDLRPLLLQALRSALQGVPRAVDAVRRTHLQPEARNKIREWFEQGLNDWDISRDAPYFGFEIPGCAGKVFLRLARRADRLLRQLPATLRIGRASISTSFVRDGDPPPRWCTSSARTSSISTRSSGPRCSKFVGPSHADARLRPRLPHGRRREDVEVARHVHHRRELPSQGTQPGVAALLLRGQVDVVDGRHRSESR